jgi:hypothetical protein
MYSSYTKLLLLFTVHGISAGDPRHRISPRSVILHAPFKTVPAEEEDGKTVREREEVGFVMAAISWKPYFSNLFPEGKNGFLAEVNDNCGSVFTYRIDGHLAEYHGASSHHDSKYRHLHQKSDFAAFASKDGNGTESKHYHYTIDMYPA